MDYRGLFNVDEKVWSNKKFNWIKWPDVNKKYLTNKEADKKFNDEVNKKTHLK